MLAGQNPTNRELPPKEKRGEGETIKEILTLLGIPELSLEGDLAQNWMSWKSKFTLYLRATESDSGTGESQVALMLKLMGPKCFNVFKSFELNEDEAKDPRKVMSKFEYFFVTEESLAVRRHRFFSRVQLHSESVNEFALDLVRRSYQCDLGELRESLIRDVLVCGLLPSYGRLKERLLGETDRSLERTLALCSEAGLPEYHQFHLDGEEEPMVPLKDASTFISKKGKDTPPGKKFWELVSQWLKSPRNIGIAVCGTALVFAAVFIITFYSIRNKGDAEDDLPTNGSSRIRRRGEWLALPSKGTLEPLKVDPPHFVLVAHTAGSKCSTQPTCAAIVRNIQAGHFSLGWDDISYNFLVGGDGYAYEGRGWGKKGAHTIPFNAYSIAIAFIGNFMIDLPPRRQIEAAFIVMEEGVRLGKLPKNYKLIFHKQVLATESPGAALIEEIKKWPHWSLCDDGECEEILRNYTNTFKKG